jgi:hypothetical protein
MHAPVTQLAEVVGSKPMRCGFESRPGYDTDVWPVPPCASNVPRPVGPAALHAGSVRHPRNRTEAGTAGTRESNRVRERLLRVQEQLRLTRANERILVEQVSYLQEVASDAETRGLVAETPLADREWREARTDLNRHTALLDEARREVEDLLAERDRLLDRLSELDTAPRRDDE